MQEWQTNWKPFTLQVNEIHLLARSGDLPFQSYFQLPFGSSNQQLAKSTNHMEPQKASTWKFTLANNDSNDNNNDSNDEKSAILFDFLFVVDVDLFFLLFYFSSINNNNTIFLIILLYQQHNRMDRIDRTAIG